MELSRAWIDEWILGLCILIWESDISSCICLFGGYFFTLSLFHDCHVAFIILGCMTLYCIVSYPVGLYCICILSLSLALGSKPECSELL